jgi:hypothetical protein
MRSRLVALVAAATVGFGLLAVPATAAAEPNPAAVEGSTTLATDATVEVTDVGDTAIDSSLSTYPSPSYCRGKSNYPHQSTSSSTYGWIKGYSETYCVANVPYIEVRATVWRKRWWGYEHVGTDGSGHYYNWYRIGRSGVFAGCQNNRWRTVGYHKVKDIDLQWYSLETQAYRDIVCW